MRTRSHFKNRPSAAFFALLFALLCGLSQGAYAVSFGELQVLSRADEPLRGRLPLLAADAYSLQALRVSVAPKREFELLGIPYSEQFQALTIRLDADAADGPLLHISSTLPLEEFAASLVLHIDWAHGEIIQKFSWRDSVLDSPAMPGPMVADAADTPAARATPRSTPAPPATLTPDRVGLTDTNTARAPTPGSALQPVVLERPPEQEVVDVLTVGKTAADPDAAVEIIIGGNAGK